MPSYSSVVPSQAAWKTLWTDPEMLALPLLTAWMDYNEPEENDEDEDSNPMNWSPLACLLDIQDDFDVTVHPSAFNRLMAARSLLKGNDFFASLPDFIRICNILTTGVHNARTLDLADSYEIVWGILEAMLIVAPEEEDGVAFDEEILAYIRDTLISQGFTNMPSILAPLLPEGIPAVAFDEFSEDVSMAQGMAQNAADRTNELTAWMTDRYFLMHQQMEKLPLRPEKMEAVKKWLAERG